MHEFVRKCPICDIQKTYTTERSYNTACKSNSKCRKCASIESGFFDRYATSKNSGEANPFFGKNHSESSKEAMRLVDKSKYKTDEFKEKMRGSVSRGKEHHMFNSSHKSHWIEMYGEQKSIELEVERRRKISTKLSGQNNPMFGRPSPQGSGYGWKGWYGDWFFRSLRELAYVINVIEPNGLEWISAESKDLVIQYVDWEGKTRNYFADFLVDGCRLVEVKPVRLHNSPNVSAKTQAARELCDKKGWIYEITDPVKLTESEIRTLRNEGRIKFTEKYEREYIKKHEEISHSDERASVHGEKLPCEPTH